MYSPNSSILYKKTRRFIAAVLSYRQKLCFNCAHQLSTPKITPKNAIRLLSCSKKEKTTSFDVAIYIKLYKKYSTFQSKIGKA